MKFLEGKASYTLAEADSLLRVEQHRLIHLCEKKVIIPDFEDASGRGTVRRFSERNLFEFAVALELRLFLLPISYIAPVIKVLRVFESQVTRKISIFSLPRSLQSKPVIGLKIIISNGKTLYFSMKRHEKVVYMGGLDLSSGKRAHQSAFSRILNKDPSQTCCSRLEIDLNQIAARIKIN